MDSDCNPAPQQVWPDMAAQHESGTDKRDLPGKRGLHDKTTAPTVLGGDRPSIQSRYTAASGSYLEASQMPFPSSGHPITGKRSPKFTPPGYPSMLDSTRSSNKTMRDYRKRVSDSIDSIKGKDMYKPPVRTEHESTKSSSLERVGSSIIADQAATTESGFEGNIESRYDRELQPLCGDISNWSTREMIRHEQFCFECQRLKTQLVAMEAAGEARQKTAEANGEEQAVDGPNEACKESAEDPPSSYQSWGPVSLVLGVAKMAQTFVSRFGGPNLESRSPGESGDKSSPDSNVEATVDDPAGELLADVSFFGTLSLDDAASIPHAQSAPEIAFSPGLSCSSTETSSTLTMESDSFEDESDFSGNDSSISSQKKALVNRLMDHFYSMFYHLPQFGALLQSHGHGSDKNNTNAMNSSTQQAPQSEASHTGLQDRHYKRGADDDGSDRGGGKRTRLDPLGGFTGSEETQKLACPFFKKDPEKYQERRSCTGPGWATVHRVKEHVYRNHALPISCPRCHEIFDNDRLKDEHIGAAERCEDREQSPLEGMDSTQERLLRSRRRSNRCASEEDKWYHVYLILFPETNPTEVPSPYYEHSRQNPTQKDKMESEFSRVDQFIRRELPSHVEHELVRRVDERLNPIEEDLRSELPGIIRNIVTSLLDTYRTLRTESSGVIGATGVNTNSLNTGSEGMDMEPQVIDEQLQPFYQPPDMDNEELTDLNFDDFLFSFQDNGAFAGSAADDSGFFSMPSEKPGEQDSADS